MDNVGSPMKFRNFRIAWLVAWGLLAVLLCVLWVRSCVRFDQVIHKTSTANYYIAITSARRQVAFGGANEPILSTIVKGNWMHRQFAMKGVYNETGSPIPVFPNYLPKNAVLLWPHYRSPFVAGQIGLTSFELRIPYWLLVFTSGALAAIAWLPWSKRFSLRTLLIATTLVAIVLGIIVWMSRDG
jgi:hypothetical protein